jgi:hypothetical protein
MLIKMQPNMCGSVGAAKHVCDWTNKTEALLATDIPDLEYGYKLYL